jgi:hypothetical protein
MVAIFAMLAFLFFLAKQKIQLAKNQKVATMNLRDM